MLYGLRGVGKTVLLREMSQRASEAGWLTVRFEAKTDENGHARALSRFERNLTLSARQLSSRVERASDKFKAALSTINAFSIGIGASGVNATFAINPTRGRADSGHLEIDVEELVADISPALLEAGIGFGVFVDEMQDLDPEMTSALLTAQHRAAQEDWPFYVFGAGLPNLPGALAEVHSYAERQFDYRLIAELNEEDAYFAFVRPAAALGVDYEDAAIDQLIEISGSYPYFIQAFGDQAWKVATGPSIARQDAMIASVRGVEELDAGFFHARWEKANTSERAFMRAMSIDNDDPSVMSVVSERLGTKRRSVSTTRQNLIRKGLLYMPAWGKIAFTVPHFARFIQRQHPED